MMLELLDSNITYIEAHYVCVYSVHTSWMAHQFLVKPEI